MHFGHGAAAARTKEHKSATVQWACLLGTGCVRRTVAAICLSCVFFHPGAFAKVTVLIVFGNPAR
jgi:hypothetical protein